MLSTRIVQNIRALMPAKNMEFLLEARKIELEIEQWWINMNSWALIPSQAVYWMM
jgi:ABC-type nickel/cobalt efflux system permease component RcnA